MTVYVLYNLQTPAERWALDLAEQLRREQINVELVDADSGRGVDFAEHYDVLGRPAVAVVRDDGSPVQVWQGMEEMPVTSDIVYLAHS